MWLYETEIGFYKRQLLFFQPEPLCFSAIPVMVLPESEFQRLTPVPEKTEPEIDFCRNSGQKMPEFDCEFW
jgi:hypothetical protein